MSKFYNPKRKVTKTTSRYFEAVGRRKTSVARVRLMPSSKSEFIINRRPLENYFPLADLGRTAVGPLALAPTTRKWLVSVQVSGGGIHSQAEAIAMGLARALILTDPDLRPVLKQKKFLRRDPRMKERRKFGLKKARKAPQWSKR